MESSEALRIIRQTRVLRPPKKRLSTFGDTRIEYHLVSAVEEMKNRCRLRKGVVLAEKPMILTPDALKERFEGFGSEGREFAEAISDIYRDVLRALEYKFRNESGAVRLLRENPKAVGERIKADLDYRNVLHAAVIACPDIGWQISLMKLVIEETRQSFPHHIREMEEHDVFDPSGRAERRRKNEIEGLFRKALVDRATVPELAKKLKECGLFEQYEDRFYSLLH